MAMYRSPLFRPVLFGSVLLVSTACRRAERSDVDDTRTSPQGTTTSQSAPAPEEQRAERIHVTGKDVDPNAMERQRDEGESAERTPVTGKDEDTSTMGRQTPDKSSKHEAERIHVIGKAAEGSAVERQRQDEVERERTQVTGRDDELQLGTGGGGGTGGKSSK